MSKPFCESGSLPPAGFASPRSYIVGITGSIATGKTEVGKILQERHGGYVIDTDHITHELLDNVCEAYNEVLAHFGEDLAPVKGKEINRDLLKERAFATPEKKAELEAIMHPRINERLEFHIVTQSNAGCKVIFVLVPLLHEADLREHFDEVWCVVAKEEVRLARLMARNGLTEAEARHLIGLQMSQTEKAELSDYLVDNSFDKETTAVRVQALFDELMKRVEQFFAAKVAPVETDDGKTSVDTPSTDGDGAPEDDSSDAPPTSDSDDSTTGDAGARTAANKRYRDLLRNAAIVGADENLGQLGDVSTTGHQEATSRMTLVVDRATDGEPDLSRELDVEVKMTVRNAPGNPSTGGCSCGCGDRCRINCACKPGCGCGCKKKPVPPPVDDDGDDDDKPRKPGKHDSRLWLVVLGLFGLLAFLFACLMLWSWNHQPKAMSGGSSVTVINQLPPTEPPVVVPPVVPPVVEPPSNPPAVPPVVVPDGTTQVSDEVPGFAFRFVHNAVRQQVVKYEVTYGGGFPTIVKGFDADNRLLVYQEYDDHQYMTFQYVMTYPVDGSTQVDRFEGRGNIFTGRSIYRVNGSGSVVRAEQYSGLKRQIFVVNFVRIGGGALSALNVEEFSPVTGAALPKKVVDGKVAAGEFLKQNFYVFDWFCQL